MNNEASGIVTIAPEVASLIGSAQNTVKSRSAHAEFNCFICEMKGDVEKGDDVSVLVVQFTDRPLLRLAHTRCSHSRIFSVDQAFTDWVGSDDYDQAPNTDVTSLAVTVPGPDDLPVATLIIDNAGVVALTRAGDTLDLWLQRLLGDGWQLYVERLDGFPPSVPGYEIRLDPASGDGEVTSPHGPLLDRLPTPLPPRWLESAFARGSVQVFAGDFQLNRLRGDLDVEGVFGLWEAARKRGDLAVATVPVSNEMPTAMSPQQEAVEVLEYFMHGVQPGSGRPLDDVPLIVPFPTEPRVLVAAHDDVPVVLIDLNDQDDDRARATLRELRRAGLRLLQKPVGSLLGSGWTAAVWSSQILIQAPSEGDLRRHLIYAQFDDPRAAAVWYRQFMERSQAIALVVLNLKGQPLTLRSLGNRLDRKRVVGGMVIALPSTP